MDVSTLRDKITDAMGALADEIKAHTASSGRAAELSALDEALRITSLILRDERENAASGN